MIKPPWITKDWFEKCRFNYCDHFGNKELLARVCIICRDEFENPYDPTSVLNDIGKTFSKTRILLEQKIAELNIDLDKIELEESFEPRDYPIFFLVEEYSKVVGKWLTYLHPISKTTGNEVIKKANDVLAHSQHFVVAKIGRALGSRQEEEKDQFMKELADSKTAAFFAYIAILRNSNALKALARQRGSEPLMEMYLRGVKLSLSVAAVIRKEFFPKEILKYEEFGIEDFES